MARIHVLDDHTANKIAAGEVVERPASVVKELIENAIDAGATIIEVSITGGGMKNITISDNGIGIDPEDALLAFERHATSKITSAEDLDGINTLGFRGEALPSIASVSRLSMKTRPEHSSVGTEVCLEGGKIIQTGDTGCPKGTTISVSDLFFNTPARQKHMKTPTTEAGKISEIVGIIAMGYPDISFQLKNEGRVILKTPGNGHFLDCVASIYGTELARELLKVEYASDLVTVSGYVGKPFISRSSRQHQTLYVNKRYIKDRFISLAVEKAFHSMLMVGRFPVYLLKIDTNPTLVDVNVHPSKTQVRFAELAEIQFHVTKAVEEALHENVLIPKTEILPKAEIPVTAKDGLPPHKPALYAEPPAKGIQEKLRMGYTVPAERLTIQETKADIYHKSPASGISPVSAHFTEAAATVLHERANLAKEAVDAVESPASPVFPEPSNSQPAALSEIPPIDKAVELPLVSQGADKQTPVYNNPPAAYENITAGTVNAVVEAGSSNGLLAELRPIGQIDQTYIVAEGEDGMYLIDQHAAHERILYEKFMAGEQEYIVAEQLLFPETIQLTHQESQLLIDHINQLADLGFIVEHFGGTSYLLRSVPAGLPKPGGKESFLDLLDYFSENKYTITDKSLKEQLLITMSCKNAIKAHDRLSLAEMEGLIASLAGAKQPYTCPHGRPTIINFSLYDLEKRFKRVV